MKAKGLLFLSWASGLLMLGSFIGFVSELFVSEMAGKAPYMLIATTIFAGIFIMASAWRKS